MYPFILARVVLVIGKGICAVSIHLNKDVFLQQSRKRLMYPFILTRVLFVIARKHLMKQYIQTRVLFVSYKETFDVSLYLN